MCRSYSHILVYLSYISFMKISSDRSALLDLDLFLWDIGLKGYISYWSSYLGEENISELELYSS